MKKLLSALLIMCLTGTVNAGENLRSIILDIQVLPNTTTDVYPGDAMITKMDLNGKVRSTLQGSFSASIHRGDGSVNIPNVYFDATSQNFNVNICNKTVGFQLFTDSARTQSAYFDGITHTNTPRTVSSTSQVYLDHPFYWQITADLSGLGWSQIDNWESCAFSLIIPNALVLTY